MAKQNSSPSISIEIMYSWSELSTINDNFLCCVFNNKCMIPLSSSKVPPSPTPENGESQLNTYPLIQIE